MGRHDYDSYLARFSRARKRDVDKAYKMLVECLEWRKEAKVDTMYEWWEKDPEFSKMATYYPYDNSNGLEGRSPGYGFGKGGRPVHLDHYPLIEPSTVLHSFSHETMVRNHIWVMEKSLDMAVAQSEKEGKPITDQVFIFNMTGLGLRHLHGDVMDSVKECFTIDEKYYPEIVHVALVINAPRIFTLLFKARSSWVCFSGCNCFSKKLVSPFVDPDTLAVSASCCLGVRCRTPLLLTRVVPRRRPRFSAPSGWRRRSSTWSRRICR